MRYLSCFATLPPFKMISNSKSTLTANFSIISFLHSLPRNREVYYWIYPSFLRKLFGKSSRAAIFERCRRSRRCRAWGHLLLFSPPEETREAMLSNLSISQLFAYLKTWRCCKICFLLLQMRHVCKHCILLPLRKQNICQRWAMMQNQLVARRGRGDIFWWLCILQSLSVTMNHSHLSCSVRIDFCTDVFIWSSVSVYAVIF